MAFSKISEAEWEVMELLWARHPISSTEVVEALSRTHSWSPTTVRTLLTRLTKKKVLSARKLNGVMVYSPLHPRSDYVETESNSFLQRVFGGSAAPLLLHFANKGRLSAEEAAQLRKLLAQHHPPKKGHA